MEVLEALIKEFLKVDNGSGYGSGSGSGSGDGYGSGYGSGYGYGDGSGSGDGSGDGYGYGSGDGIKMIDNYHVHIIDDVVTIITKIRNNIAKGFILNNDFTKEPCFVVKSNNFFAHGRTLNEAMQSLQDKVFEDLSEEERIQMFIDEFKNFKPNQKFKGSVFFDWHNKLTGSCLMGRNQFVKDKELSLDDGYTVNEFIELTLKSYNGHIIQKLKEEWEKEK